MTAYDYPNMGMKRAPKTASAARQEAYAVLSERLPSVTDEDVDNYVAKEIIEIDGHPCEFTTITVPITADNLPAGPQWEADGACWKAIPDAAEPSGWRWQPQNWKAFGKERPTGVMSPHLIAPGLKRDLEQKPVDEG